MLRAVENHVTWRHTCQESLYSNGYNSATDLNPQPYGLWMTTTYESTTIINLDIK
jgi:hypothetical protein